MATPSIFNLANDLKRTEQTALKLNHITQRLDPRASRLKPTSGKKIDEQNHYQKEFMDLNALKLRHSDIYKKYEAAMISASKVTVEGVYNELVAQKNGEEPTSAEVQSHEKYQKSALAISDLALVRDKMIDKIFDPSLLTEHSIEDLDQKCRSDDLNPDEKSVLLGYLDSIKPIVEEVAKIKKKVLDESRTQQLSDTPTKLQNSANGDKNLKIPERTLDQWVYDVELYYIRPDNEIVRIDQFINEFVYTMEYDLLVMPVYSVAMTITDLHYRDFKNDFEQLRFYMTIRKWERNKMKQQNEYLIKTTVLENHPMTPVNPVLPTDAVLEANPVSGVPRHRVTLDLVSRRNIDVNGKVRAKVYNDVTMFDVIVAILNEAYVDQKNKKVADKDIVKFAITPPDNVTKYEQVVLDPGSVAQNLKQLQEKYGVYRTGIRVMFDTVVSEKDETTGTFINKTLVTVTDKGGTAPGKDTVEQCLIEVLDQNSRDTSPELEDGSSIDKNANIFVVRTMQPYEIQKNNAARIIDGDNVRIIQTGQNEVVMTECDINMDDDATQRTYWGNNDNPYNLTQLQDSIREKALSLTVQLCNVDAFAMTENLQYTIKFYNKDDQLHSGSYRLKAAKYYFTSPHMSEKVGVPVTAFLYFTNIPDITVNGAVVKRETYVEKVRRMRQSYSYFREKASSGADGRSGSVRTPPIISATSKEAKGPFPCSFWGKRDYLGSEIPKEVPPSYKMSDHITLLDTYALKDQTDPSRAAKICANFELFCFAQKFSKQMLDPIVNKYGKFPGGGGKMNSFYRYDIPSGGSTKSAHLWALAADIIPSPGQGDLLCEPFFWLATQSGLNFDQIILEGNGSQWRWIHVALNYNATQRRQILLSFDARSYHAISASQITSPDLLKFSKAARLKGSY